MLLRISPCRCEYCKPKPPLKALMLLLGITVAASVIAFVANR